MWDLLQRFFYFLLSAKIHGCHRLQYLYLIGYIFGGVVIVFINVTKLLSTFLLFAFLFQYHLLHWNQTWRSLAKFMFLFYLFFFFFLNCSDLYFFISYSEFDLDFSTFYCSLYIKRSTTTNRLKKLFQETNMWYFIR